MSNSCLQCGWFLWPLNTPLYINTGPHIRPTVRGARREGRIRSVCCPPAPHPLVKKKRKTTAFCLTGHKSIVYSGAHFPLSSAGPKKNICFAWGSWGQVFPSSQTVTQAGRWVGVLGAGGFQRRWCTGMKTLISGRLINLLCGSKASAARPIYLMKKCMQSAWFIVC